MLNASCPMPDLREYLMLMRKAILRSVFAVELQGTEAQLQTLTLN
jgi:hypothetical protein